MFLRVDMTLKMVGKVESLLFFFKGKTFFKRDKKIDDFAIVSVVRKHLSLYDENNFSKG